MLLIEQARINVTYLYTIVSYNNHCSRSSLKSCNDAQLRCRNSSVYLGTLAAVDSGFLVALFGVWLSFVGGDEAFHRAGWCQTIVYVTHVCSFLSVWTVVAFTCENWVVIYCPLRRHALCTRRRAAGIMGSLTAIAVTAYSTGVWMRRSPSSRHHQSSTVTVSSLLPPTAMTGVMSESGTEELGYYEPYMVSVSEEADVSFCTLGHDSVEMQRYFAAGDTIASVVVPSLVIIVLNYAIWIKVTRYLHKRKAIASDGGSDPKGINGQTSMSEESGNRRVINNNLATCRPAPPLSQSSQQQLQQSQQYTRKSPDTVELEPFMTKWRAVQQQCRGQGQLPYRKASSSVPLVRSCTRHDCAIKACSVSCGEDAQTPRPRSHYYVPAASLSQHGISAIASDHHSIITTDSGGGRQQQQPFYHHHRYQQHQSQQVANGQKHQPRQGQLQQSKPSQSVRVRATRALAVMSAVFLLLHLPSHGFRLHALAMLLTRQPYELSVDSLLVQELFQFMYYVKFSSNLFVYFACWKDFRWAVRRFARGLCSPYRRLRQSRRR